MSGRQRVFAWVTLPEGLTIPDRSHVLRRIVRERDGAPVPEGRSFLNVTAEEDDGGRSAEMVFWYGRPENFDREAAEEHGVELLAAPRVADRPELPDGWRHR